MVIQCDPGLRARLIAVAQEQAAPDLLIRGARVWNAYTGEILPGDIVVCADRIAKVGPWKGDVPAETVLIEADGRVAVPGYIEPHTHPWPFANPLSLGEAAVCRGTTCLVYDELMLHLAMGTQRLLEATRAMSAASLPHIFWVARIASQSRFDGEGTFFSHQEIYRLLDADHFIGTGEMTRWADLLDPALSPPLLTILEDVRRANKINDGHFAGASPRRLAALANAGIHSCHEAINPEEVLERLRQGLWVFLRNSSLREDLLALLPALDKTAFHDRIAYTTDGAGESHVAATGLIEHLIGQALGHGVAPNLAYRMATLNPASFLRMDQDMGAVVAGRIANSNLLASMQQPTPDMVVCRGRLVAVDRALVVAPPSADFSWDAAYEGSEPDIPQWGPERFVLPEDAPNPFPAGRLVNAAIPREVATPLRACRGGLWPSEGLMLAASDRGGNWICRGVVHNFGEEVDALAATYTTNTGILVLGRTPEAMAEALSRLRSIHGGITVHSSAGVWADFPLAMAGIHGREGFVEAARRANEFHSVFSACGYPHSDPKYTLLFLTCDMLPEVRATEAGWIRVKTGELLLAAERLRGRVCVSPV
jgi:adenine deaminase